MAPVIRWSPPGRIIRRWATILGLALSALSGAAQTPSPAATTTETTTTANAPAPAFQLAEIKKAGTASDAKPAMSAEEFHATVAAALVAALNKPEEKSSDLTVIWTAVGTALIALVGVLVSAWLSRKISTDAITAAKGENVFKAQQEKEKARIDAALACNARMLDLEYRQLEKFYAPLLARAQQCKGINEKLTLYLYNKSPKNNYDWKADGKGVNRLQVKGSDGAMVDFRLLNQLPTLKDDPVALALVDQILAIDGEMVGIIRQHNGLATVEKSMDPVYGRFLAHYTIIKLERGKLNVAGCSTAAHAPGTHGDAYYPRGLDDLILQEYNNTRATIKKYKDMSEAALKWLGELPK